MYGEADTQLTVENLSLFSMQNPKPLAFLPPSKRAQKATKVKADKKKSKDSNDAKGKDGKGRSPGARVTNGNGRDKGKGKADELAELVDNSQFDLLQALENVDRFRAEGPAADNAAHMRTLAMLSAATGGALKGGHPGTPGHQLKEANTSGENGSGELNTSAETGEKRKMHNSFNTTTTESFGHLHHLNGQPVPAPTVGPSGRFTHHRHQSSAGALPDISEATESRDARHHMTTVEDVPDVSLDYTERFS